MNATRTPPRRACDVVALVTSAGGLDALSAVLGSLPAEFPAAILVGQHLGETSKLVDILRRRTELPVTWAADGMSLVPGRVHVSPPRCRLEILSDRSLAVAPVHGEVFRVRPLDLLLESLASAVGPDALAVVLTGTGRDGASGARAVREAGGSVIAQSEETADFPEMPRAAVTLGAADQVLPLAEIGDAVIAWCTPAAASPEPG